MSKSKKPIKRRESEAKAKLVASQEGVAQSPLDADIEPPAENESKIISASAGPSPVTKPAFVPMAVYQRARWKHGTRYFGVFFICLLNLALVMSDVERYNKHFHISLQQEFVTFLGLLFLDITVLLPIILEVDRVEVTDSKLILKTIFWTSKLAWEDISKYMSPPMLKFAVLRSPRCFYLINRRDIKNYPELAQTITQRLASTSPRAVD